jgi:pentatricopeptide repeat protein
LLPLFVESTSERHRLSAIRAYSDKHPYPRRLKSMPGSPPLRPVIVIPGRKYLSKEVKSYIHELYVVAMDETNARRKQRAWQLKKFIRESQARPETGRLLIKMTLAYEKRNPGCRKLVDDDCFFLAIYNYARLDQIEQAEELLAWCKATEHVRRPHRNCYGVIMNAYAKRRTIEALKKIEEMLTLLEEERMQKNPTSIRKQALDCYKYNILMNAYMRVYGVQSIQAVKQTFDRMADMAKRLDDDSLRPNLACYTTLMKAYMLRPKSGFALEANAILDRLRSEANYVLQPAKERQYLENMVIDAWSKSNDPDALNRARQIFNAMEEPNSVAYNSLCNLYAEVGDIDEVFRLYEAMQADFDSGMNTTCCPDVHTYATILKALQKSNRPDAIEKAEQVFKLIPLPNTITYTTLINIYAQRGRVEQAFDLFNKMQSEFDSGKNKDCRPGIYTYAGILNALQKSNRSDAAEKAEQIFHAIPSPNTVLYTTLINIYARKGDVEKAISLLETMKSDFESGKNLNCCPAMHTYAILMIALQTSHRSDAVERALQMIRAIPSPNTVLYNTLLNMYAHNGDIEKASDLVRRMQSDFDTGKNTECCPDMHSYNTILKGLLTSTLSNATEEAEQVFNTIPSPDTITYTTLLSIYARNGDAEKALVLFDRMRSDFDSGTNKSCCPNTRTLVAVFTALQKSTIPNAAEKAEQIISSIPLPDTATYNALLNFYAECGMGQNVVSVTRRMQSDFDSGKNPNCEPDVTTRSTLLRAFQMKGDDALENEGQALIGWFDRQTTED